MKKLLFIFISLFCLKYNYALSQDVKIKWEDRDGREFSIKTISGEFEYSMVGGDSVYYYSKFDFPYRHQKKHDRLNFILFYKNTCDIDSVFI